MTKNDEQMMRITQAIKHMATDPDCRYFLRAMIDGSGAIESKDHYPDDIEGMAYHLGRHAQGAALIELIRIAGVSLDQILHEGDE